MRIALLQSNYIPWKGNFDMIAMSDVYVIYDEVQYTKGDWRNRNKIKTLKGDSLWLSVPVKLERSDQLIEETFLADDSWRRKHWAQIESNYAKARYFRDYKDRIKELYETSPTDRISAVNRHFLEGLCRILEIKTPIRDSREFALQGDKQGKLIDLCKKLGAEVYLVGPAAKSYIDESLFAGNGIKIEWMDYSGYPEYPQVAGPFEHGVTVLDLLFNVGPDFARYFKALG